MNLCLKNNHLIKLFLTLTALSIFGYGQIRGSGAEAKALTSAYPRLANIYYTPQLTMNEARSLSRWDAVIISMENQYTNPAALRLMRQLNPDIVILAYMSSQEIPETKFLITDRNHPDYKLIQGLSSQWYLRDPQGKHVVFWPGTRMMNVTNTAPLYNGLRWNTYLPKFAHNTVMSTGLWDGIYYDNMWNDVAWLNNGYIDLNQDGKVENAETLNQSWRDGMSDLLSYSRELEGSDKIIIGGGNGQYYDSINGRLFEEFPSANDGYWGGAMDKYLDAQNHGQAPSVIIINSSTTTGKANDYRQLRYMLASTLLGNGFASYDYGPLRHADLWWYDEYNVFLGQPNTGPTCLTHPGASIDTLGVWKREFANGLVLVNSASTSQRVELGAGYEKILGTQAPAINSGEIVNSVTLPSRDGLIVLKRQFDLEQGRYTNGLLTRSFTLSGTMERQGFFTYTTAYAGGVEIVKEDINNDGKIETILGWNSKVQIYNSGGFLQNEFYPYGVLYNKGIHIAVGDIDGNGRKEIITGTGNGGGPHVKVFSSNGRITIAGFFAYDKNFRGGVNVSAGDINGDGLEEIITGAGRGGGPHVRIFNRYGQPIAGFFAYDKNFRGGVSVAAANIVGDKRAEIITGAGPGGGPHVRTFNGYGRPLTPGFFGYDQNWRQGIVVSTADINRDGRQEILVSTQNAY